MVDKYIKSNICPLPWTGLEVGVNGGAAPCCLYKGQVPNVKVYETDLKEIEASIINGPPANFHHNYNLLLLVL